MPFRTVLHAVRPDVRVIKLVVRPGRERCEIVQIRRGEQYVVIKRHVIRRRQFTGERVVALAVRIPPGRTLEVRMSKLSHGRTPVQRAGRLGYRWGGLR